MGKILTTSQYLAEHAADIKCMVAEETVGHLRFLIEYDHDCIIISQSPVDGTRKLFVLTSLGNQEMYFAHYIISLGQTREKEMYHTMHQQYYRPLNEINIHTTA